MKLNTQLTQRQEQILTPQMVQSLEILQLPMMDLVTLIKQELESNPTLEIAQEETELAEEIQEEIQKEETSFVEEILTQEDKEDSSARLRKWQRDLANKKLEALQNVPAKSMTLQDYLYQQIVLMEVPPHVHEIAKNIIYNLDDNGYLKVSLEEIAKASLPQIKIQESYPNEQTNLSPSSFSGVISGPPNTTNQAIAEVAEVLRLIQKLDPPGVGARNLEECLLLQLSEDDPYFELKKHLITKHLKDIQMNKLPRLAKEIKISLEELKKVVEEITLLNPYPGANFSNEVVYYIIPDIIVENIDGQYEIKLNNEYIPTLSLNRYYLALLNKKEISQETYDFLKKKIEAARRIITSIQMRQNTLYRITRELVQIQQPFLDKGIESLKPLKMQEVAERLGLHVATVSRAVAGKYIQTPRGIFPLKFFFARSTETTSGASETHQNVLNILKELIEKENKQTPLSDQELVNELKKRGIKIARRTVTKYRQILKISSASQRKKY